MELREDDLELRYMHLFEDYQGYDDIYKRWKVLLLGRHPLGARESSDGAIVGNALHPYQTSDLGGEDYSSNDVSRYPFTRVRFVGDGNLINLCRL